MRAESPAMETSPCLDSVYPLPHFVGDFANQIKESHHLRYCFVIGAGASHTSGIPTGASLVDSWLRARFEQEHPGAVRTDIARWAEETFRSWIGFTWANRVSFYGHIYRWYFRDNAAGQAALRSLMVKKLPSFGYSVLAAVLSGTPCKVVITTNFDNLVRDALGLLAPDMDPFICHGENDARFLAGHAGRVRIVKIHGDIDRETYNAADQIEKLHEIWASALQSVLTDHIPIFLGYGGNDPGFMRFLVDDAGIFPGRPIWAYRVDFGALGNKGNVGNGLSGAPPGWPTNSLVHRFMSKRRGLWLPVPGFDELMLLLGHALGYDNRATHIRAAADRRAQDYERTLATAVRAVRALPSASWCPPLAHMASAAERALLGEAKQRTWDEWHVALTATPSRADQEVLVKEALRELPQSPELKAWYASFIAEASPQAPEVNEHIREARALAEQSEGPASSATSTVLYHLARIEYCRGHLSEAEKVAKEALAGRPVTIDHPETLEPANVLAIALAEQGRSEEAEVLFRDVLEMRTSMLGPDHLETLASGNNLAALLAVQGKYPEAEQLHRLVLEKRLHTLMADHPDTLTSMSNLAGTLVSQGKYKEADELYEQALERRQRTLGVDHPDTLMTLNNLGLSFYQQSRYGDSEHRHRDALDGQRRALGPDHRHTLATMAHLADALEGQRRSSEAEEFYRIVLDRSEKLLGPEDDLTLHAIEGLAAVKEARPQGDVVVTVGERSS